MSKCVYDRMISVGRSCITSTMIRCKYFNDKTEDAELFYDKNLFTSDKYLPGSNVFDWLITPPESLLKCLKMVLLITFYQFLKTKYQSMFI